MATRRSNMQACKLLAGAGTDNSDKPRSALHVRRRILLISVDEFRSRRQATYLFPVLPVIPVVPVRIMLQHLADFLAMTEPLTKKTLTELTAAHHLRRAARTGRPGRQLITKWSNSRSSRRIHHRRRLPWLSLLWSRECESVSSDDER